MDIFPKSLNKKPICNKKKEEDKKKQKNIKSPSRGEGWEHKNIKPLILGLLAQSLIAFQDWVIRLHFVFINQ